MKNRVQGAIDALRGSELAGLATDTGYVAIWQGSIAFADFATIALLTHGLGLAAYGTFAIVVATVTLIGEFLNVRSAIAATTFGAHEIGRSPAQLAGVFQISYIIEFTTAALAALVVALLAAVAGAGIVGGGHSTLLLLFAPTLFAAAFERPSLALLRLLDRFRVVAGTSVVMELCRVIAVLLAVVLTHSLTVCVAAYAMIRLISGFVSTAFAEHAFHVHTGGDSLRRFELRAVERTKRKRMLRTVFHTNVMAYARLTQAQLPTILLGIMVGRTETALYKLGTAAGAALGKMVDPATAALLPRFSRLWAHGEIKALRILVRQASMIAIPLVMAGATLLIVFREPVLRLLGGDEAEAAGTVLVLATISQASYGIAFWRLALLYASQRADIVAWVAALAAITQVLGCLILIPLEGAVGAAVALLLSGLVVAIPLTYFAVRVLGTASQRTGSHEQGIETSTPASAGAGNDIL